MIALADLIAPLTRAEARASVYGVLAQLGVPTTSWRPNAVVRSLVELCAILLAGVSTVIVAVTRMGFREYATGDFETIRARGFYGLDRLVATFATGTITLQNTAGGSYTFAAGDCIVQLDSTGATYRNVSSFTLSPGTLLVPTTATFDAIATVAGSASNAAASASMSLVTPLIGVTVSANTAITGRDDETDAELKLREDAAIDLLSPNGPSGAYLACARAALRADGSNIGITRVAMSAPSSTGEITCTVATATGGVSGTVGTPGDDLDYVDQYVQGVVPPGCVPLGVTANVASATPHPIDVDATISVYTTDGRTKAQIETAAEALLAAWIPQRPIGGDSGGKIYASAVRAAAMSVSAYCFVGAVSTPAADVTIAANEVPTAGTITVTATLVSP